MQTKVTDIYSPSDKKKHGDYFEIEIYIFTGTKYILDPSPTIHWYLIHKYTSVSQLEDKFKAKYIGNLPKKVFGKCKPSFLIEE
jgi:hypothetical protein